MIYIDELIILNFIIDFLILKTTSSILKLNVKNSRLIIIILSVVLLVVQFYRFNIIETDRYKLNAIDYEITRKICERIYEYEKQSGSKITKIAIYADKSLDFTYSGIFATGDTNLKAYYKDWSTIAIFRYYLGIHLELVDANLEFQTEFEQKNWTSFENEQLIFEGDTLHLCRY